MSYYDLEAEFRAGKKSGNADALKRCDNPQNCKCPDMDTSETLKGGICNACRRRAEIMVLEEIEQKMMNSTDTTVTQTEDSIDHRQENELGKPVREVNQEPGTLTESGNEHTEKIF